MFYFIKSQITFEILKMSFFLFGYSMNTNAFLIWLKKLKPSWHYLVTENVTRIMTPLFKKYDLHLRMLDLKISKIYVGSQFLFVVYF